MTILRDLALVILEEARVLFSPWKRIGKTKAKVQKPCRAAIITRDTLRSTGSIKYSIEWFKPRFEIVGIAAGLILIGLNYRQWKTAQEQLTEMHKQRVVEERGWISMTDPHYIAPLIEEHIVFAIVLFNPGKTPAFIENIEAELWECDENLTHKNFIRNIPANLTTKTIIAPNYSSMLDFGVNQLGTGKFDLFKTGKIKMLLPIKVTYKDAFDIERHTDQTFIIEFTEIPTSLGFRTVSQGRMD